MNTDRLLAALEAYRASAVATADVAPAPPHVVAEVEQVVAALRATGWNDLMIGSWVGYMVRQMMAGLPEDGAFGVSLALACRII